MHPQPDLIVPLRSRRKERAELVQQLQHAIPGFVLLTAGLQTLTQTPHGAALALAMFEVVSSVLLLGNFANRVRANRHLLHRAPHASVHWISPISNGPNTCVPRWRPHETAW
jgi:hypothetical protein